ncbi:MAG: 3D domain-containing protein [Candidatus Eisenbacteria bacterium]|uniref:3D domain-containing protein n=1 Tax=Eiseniibacteriota bacterium TaxID=2212470 RepID=A0A956LZQ4_UNCEI|nr:3D domain-containing protein [Candidatus Eisenbacteria bacterium]
MQLMHTRLHGLTRKKSGGSSHPAILQALGAALALAAVVAGVRLIDGSITSSSAQSTPPLDADGWRSWLSDVGVEGNLHGTPIWQADLQQRPEATEDAAPAPEKAHFIRVDITGYCSRVEETDADPFVTAICTVTGTGVIALSRDLLRTFTPGAPFDFGDKVLLPGVGIFSVEDTMHPRWQRRADIWFPNLDLAYAWGRRVGFLTRVDGDTPLFPTEPAVAQALPRN